MAHLISIDEHLERSTIRCNCDFEKCTAELHNLYGHDCKRRAVVLVHVDGVQMALCYVCLENVKGTQANSLATMYDEVNNADICLVEPYPSIRVVKIIGRIYDAQRNVLTVL